MENIIKAAVERGASDIHIKAGDVFRARIGGVLRALTKQRLTAEQTRTIALDMIPNEEDRKRIDQIRDYDCSWGAPGIGRFRVNILRQRSSFMVVLRAIPFDVPTLDRLNLPKVLAAIAELESGVVLVTGGAGSGKTSTIAALLHHINSTTTRHVITIEDPIEFLHRDLKSSITQREVGMDTESFATALKAVTRQDPDVIVLGDVPDATSVDAIMRAAEVGKLAIASISAADAPHAVDRLVGMFAPAEQESVRVRLIEVLAAVVSQKLVSRAEGDGLVVAAEVARGTPEVRDALRDPTRATDELPGVIAAARDSQAMQTFDQHLADLVDAEVISAAVAKTAARNPKTFSGKKQR